MFLFCLSVKLKKVTQKL